MPSRALLMSILLPFGAAAAATPVDFDGRVAVTRPGAQFLPIGIVGDGKAIAYATGSLVSECHVLTVKHAAGRVAAVVTDGSRPLPRDNGGVATRLIDVLPYIRGHFPATSSPPSALSFSAMAGNLGQAEAALSGRPR